MCIVPAVLHRDVREAARLPLRFDLPVKHYAVVDKHVVVGRY